MKSKKNNTSFLCNGPMPDFIGNTDMKPYNFIEPDENSLEVNMYGQVVESRPVDWWTGEPVKGLYIVLAEFLSDLNVYKEKNNITFRINSVGGDLYAGIAICNRISELKGNTVTIADGLAASAASIILQGGKTRKAFAGSQVMVHGASIFMFGSYNLKDLKQMENRISGGNKSALETYAARSGKDKDYIKSLMDEERWMTGQEAVEEGFIDEIIETSNQAKLSLSADKKIIVANGIPMSAMGFHNIPDNIPVMEITSGQENQPAVIDNNNQKVGGKEKMTADEIKKKYPDLVSQIENELKQSTEQTSNTDDIKNQAVKEERDRLKEIAEIENQIADKELVNAAKFGEKPMTAQQLAFEAMKKQKNTGEQFLSDLNEDAQTSNVNNVTPAPNAGTKSTEEQQLEDISNGASLIANYFKA